VAWVELVIERLMAQGGWRDERSMEHYEHDVPAVRQAAIRQLAISRP